MMGAAETDIAAPSYRLKDGLHGWIQEVRRASNRLPFLCPVRPSRAWNTVGRACGSCYEEGWTSALQGRRSDIKRIRRA